MSNYTNQQLIDFCNCEADEHEKDAANFRAGSEPSDPDDVDTAERLAVEYERDANILRATASRLKGNAAYIAALEAEVQAWRDKEDASHADGCCESACETGCPCIVDVDRIATDAARSAAESKTT